MRISISAKSAASTPPAPERMVSSASRTSYSPDSSVRTSRLCTIVRRRASSALGLGQRVGVALLAGELEEHVDVVEPVRQRGEPLELALQRGEATGDALGVRLVVPQVGRGDELTELGDLPAHAVGVEHLLDGVHRRAQLLDLGL